MLVHNIKLQHEEGARNNEDVPSAGSLSLCNRLLIVSDLLSGRWSSFYAGWQLGGRETDRPGYRERAGRGGGPGSHSKGTATQTKLH